MPITAKAVAATAANSGLETAVESNGVGTGVGVGVPDWRTPSVPVPGRWVTESVSTGTN